MFRRSRLSIRPNVGTAGRTPGSTQETVPNNADNANTTAEPPVSVPDHKSDDPPPEQTPGTDQNGEAASSSAIQRRKRFSVRPKVVPGRPSALPRTPKSPIKPVLPAVKSPAPVIDKAATLIKENCTAPHQELLTPPKCQISDESTSKIDIVSPSEGSSICIDQPGKIQSSQSQVKEISPKAPVPSSIPDREASDISEKAKTLVSKAELATSSQHFSLTQLLNDKADLLRLEKARKLRQLLKQEMHKEKSKKYLTRVKECSLDPSKMTMRDLIHYLPTSNPMSSTLEDSAQENETAIPQSPGREISPERAQEQVQPKILSPCQGEAKATTSAEGEQEQEEEEAEEAAEDEDALMVPQVKVAEDGSLIIDEESLTVEVQRMKGPNPIQDRDPIFERGSTTTYSSFRKGTHTKPWSTEETDMFFLAISMVGTDFAMISQLFPHRARSEIKNKFKKEERCNAWRIDKAFRERRKLDLEYFKKLLEKILEFQQNRKKLKSICEKPKTCRRKAKGKKAMVELSDVEEENEDEVSIEEQEGEKENLCYEKSSSSKTKHKRKHKDDHSPESPTDKKTKKRKKKKKSGEDITDLTDMEEVAVPQDLSALDQAKKTESQDTKTVEPKSGKALPVGRKRQKTKISKTVLSDTEDETTNEESEGQMKKDSQCSGKRMSDNDSSDHETTVQSPRPSRYGRISKPVQPLNYPHKEDSSPSASDAVVLPAKAKNKTHGKKRRSAQQKAAKESKKPKLITLRASQSEGTDDDDDDHEKETDALHYDDENSTSAFVPASLCSPKPVVPEVEETMEELDMLAHMPDVLGMSENALCPDSSCEQVQNERGTVEPCEHQLDLLVDVIDFLSENAEASEEESYNEAAQTLLTIGNLANLPQPTESQPSLSDDVSRFESYHCSEVDDLSKSSFEQEQSAALIAEPSKTENIPTNSPMEQPPSSVPSDTPVVEPSEELSNTEETDSSTQIPTPKAKKDLAPKKGSLSSIIQKPNSGCATRTTTLPTQPVSATMSTQQVEVEIAATSQHQSLGQLEECTLDISEPSKTDSRPADDTKAVKTTSCVSNTQVSNEPSSKQDIVDSPPQQTTPEPKMTSLPPMKPRRSKIKPNISCALRTTKQTVEDVEEKAQVESESTSSQLESLEHQEQSIHAVSGQDESCSTQGAAASSQVDPVCPKNSSFARKARLSKIKPKPNIGRATRTTKQTSQLVHAVEEKLQNESEMASTSQFGSSHHLIESTETVSEQSNCKNKSTDDTTKEMPVSHTSDTQAIKHSDESSSTQEASQLENPCGKSSSPPGKEGLSKIKLQPNIESASRSTNSQAADTTDEKHESVGETPAVSELLSPALPLSESVVGSCGDFHQESLTVNVKGTGTDQSNRSTMTHSDISGPQEEAEEPSTVEKHLGQFTAISCTPSDRVVVEPQPRSAENIAPLEPEIIPPAQIDQSSAEKTQENIRPVQLSDQSLESVKTSTPQRRRWFPKVKPKPNLVSSPRTAKSRVEPENKSQETDQLVKSSLLNEQHIPKDGTTTKPCDHLQSDDVEPHSTSTVSSILGSSLGATERTQLDAGSVNTDIKFTSTFDPGTDTRPIEGMTSDKNDGVPAVVQEHDELQTNVAHCSLMDCAPSYSPMSSKTVHQPQEPPRENTEICLESKTSILHVENSEISSDHVRTAEGAVEPPSDLQHNDDAAPSGLGQMLNSSIQNSFEYRSLLFPNIPPDQVPSDPDEPFFILSLTEIPVCPSGEVVDPMPESYQALPNTEAQQSNPVEPVVLLAAGIDDSLSNIHIPTPEKATLKSGPICLEEYLPFTPSVDISLLEDPQGDVQMSNRSPNLTRKTAAKKTDKQENMTQDPPESFTQNEKNEVVEGQSQETVDGPPVISKVTAKTRGSKRQTKKSKVSGELLSGQIETQSSEAQAANASMCSSSSKDRHCTSSFELLDPNQNDSTNVLDEGPTNVSQYFLCDIFTEVESDCSVTGNTVPLDKTNMRQQSNSPLGQRSSIIVPHTSEATVDDATSSDLPGCTAPETSVRSNQQDNEKSRGRGKRNRKNTTTGEAKAENSRSGRKSTAAKFPEALPQDTLKESTSSSSTVPPQTHETNQQNTLPSTSEFLGSHQSDSIGSSFLEEEPTNVAQYFISDVFTEVETNDFSVTVKSARNASSSDSTPSQKAETTMSERQTKKASSDAPSGQHSSVKEGQPLDATSLSTIQNTPSCSDLTNADSSERGSKKPRGKESSTKKSKAVCTGQRTLRKSTEALKTSEVVLQDSLKKTQSISSAVEPQDQRGSILGSTETPAHCSVEVDPDSRKKVLSNPPQSQEQVHKVTQETQKTAAETTRGKGSLKRKTKASDGATAKRSQQRRQDTVAAKCPSKIKEAVSSSSSMVQPELQANNQSDASENSLFDDEPTNVSQYFLSDIFTDVDEEFKS